MDEAQHVEQHMQGVSAPKPGVGALADYGVGKYKYYAHYYEEEYSCYAWKQFIFCFHHRVNIEGPNRSFPDNPLKRKVILESSQLSFLDDKSQLCTIHFSKFG